MERLKKFVKEWVKFMIVIYITAGSTFGLISYYRLYEMKENKIEEKMIEDGQKRNSGTEGSITLYELDRKVQHNQR